MEYSRVCQDGKDQMSPDQFGSVGWFHTISKGPEQSVSTSVQSVPLSAEQGPNLTETIE